MVVAAATERRASRVIVGRHTYTVLGKFSSRMTRRSALTLHEQNLADFGASPGPDHPDALASRNNVAVAYQSAGRIACRVCRARAADIMDDLGNSHFPSKPQTMTY